MPKFLRIGVHQSNVSGYTSKAWWVRRVGSTVFLKWGAVEVHGVGDGRKIYWALPPRAKTIRCGTVQRAKDYAKTAIARRRSHRYEPLLGNIAIRRRPANRGAELEQALATILFVDIVRSTEKAARLGDSRWTQVMNHYYAAVRRELKTLRGKEVVTTGDGLLATFDAPASGVRCATAIREAVRTLGLEIRVGLHAGEYKVSGADRHILLGHVNREYLEGLGVVGRGKPRLEADHPNLLDEGPTNSHECETPAIAEVCAACLTDQLSDFNQRSLRGIGDADVQIRGRTRTPIKTQVNRAAPSDHPPTRSSGVHARQKPFMHQT